MVFESYLIGIGSGLTVEALKKLGIQWKGAPTPFRDAPHWRLGQRPAIGRAVIGRDELTGLVADQLGNRRTVAIVKGMGGVGKTTVARHFVELYGARFHGVLWVQAEDETTLVNDLALLAAAVKAPGIEYIADAKARAQACLDAVSGSDKDWLIVFDNAPDEAALAKWTIEGMRLRVLVTSRATDWSPAYRTVTADCLPTETVGDPGPQLLMAEAGRRDAPEEARALAEDLGGLPLALVAAGGLIRDVGGGYAKYRAALGNVLTAEVQGYHVPDGLSRSVIGAVKLSYDALADDARLVLDLFAWFAPEGLESALLKDVPRGSRVEGSIGDLPAELLALCGDPDRVEAALLALARRSLLVREGESYALHRMSAASVRALQGQAGRRDTAARQAATVLAAAYPGGGERSPAYTENWPACARLTPHVLALHRAWLAEDDRPDSGAAAYLFNQTCIYLLEMAEFGPALALAEDALALKRARLPESDLRVALGWSNLGDMYTGAGIPEKGVEAGKAAVDLGEAHDHGAAFKARAYDNLGSALFALWRKQGDQRLLEQMQAADNRSLAIRLDEFGPESAEVAQSLQNQATVRQALGETETALDLSRQALAIRRKVLPTGDVRLGISLASNGSLHLALGQAGVARALLSEALELFRAPYQRKDHPNVVTTAGLLVSSHLVLARRDAAQAAEARRIADEFGLDWDDAQRKAEHYPDPVD